MIPSRGFLLARRFALTALAAGLAGTPLRAEENVIGRQQASSDELLAIFYDFKQDGTGKPTGVRPEDYPRLVADFLEKGWDEAALDPYFRVTKALYATQIFIPLMGAGEAPKAFGVEKIVEPSRWIIHYKGQVSPPEDGVYRFLAYADDIIAVGVDGKTVCIGSRNTSRVKTGWQPAGASVGSAAGGGLTPGDWIPLKAGEPIDLDVIVGERPGGGFCAFLLYEKQGETYPKDDKGNTRYPVFQLAAAPVPDLPLNLAPHVSTGKPWTGHR